MNDKSKSQKKDSKIEVNKAETKQTGKKTETKKTESKKSAAKKSDVNKSDVKKVDAKKAEAKEVDSKLKKDTKKGLGKGLGKCLGKGINNLIPQSQVETEKKAEKPEEKVVVKEVVKEVIVKEPAETTLRLSLIEPNKGQPRKEFNEDALIELADSIKQYGIIQPIIVQKNGAYYEIIAGERRWRAAKLAGLKEVPVVIKDFSNQEKMEIALIENIQREDLNPIEEAKAYEELIEEFGFTHDKLAERISKSRAAITNVLRLLHLDAKVQDMVIERKLTMGHARALIAIENKDVQHELALKVFDEKLSVRETERLIKKYKEDKKPVLPAKKTAADLYYEQYEEKISSVFGTSVKIKNSSKNKGKIEIQYNTREELERIYDLINKKAR